MINPYLNCILSNKYKFLYLFNLQKKHYTSIIIYF